MSKIFSPLNLITVLVVIGVIYLGYQEFFVPENYSPPQEHKKEDDLSSRSTTSDRSETEKEEQVSDPSQDNQTPTPDIIKKREESLKKRKQKKLEEEEEERKNGFYKNETYNYQVTYPKDWPLRIRTKQKVAFGYVFPENGMGAVKVEIGKDTRSEIQEAKQKAQSQAGISIEEKKTTVDGQSATKYIFTNSLAGDKDFYILVEHQGYDYIIKYPDESPEFVSQAERVVANFKFLEP